MLPAPALALELPHVGIPTDRCNTLTLDKNGNATWNSLDGLNSRPPEINDSTLGRVSNISLSLSLSLCAPPQRLLNMGRSIGPGAASVPRHELRFALPPDVYFYRIVHTLVANTLGSGTAWQVQKVCPKVMEARAQSSGHGWKQL